MCCSSQLHKSAHLTHLAHPKPCIRLLFFCCPLLHHTLSAIIIISFYFNFSIIIIISFFVWSPAPQLTRKAAANIIRSFGSVSSFSTSLHFWISFSCSFSSNHSAGTEPNEKNRKLLAKKSTHYFAICCTLSMFPGSCEHCERSFPTRIWFIVCFSV